MPHANHYQRVTELPFIWCLRFKGVAILWNEVYGSYQSLFLCSIIKVASSHPFSPQHFSLNCWLTLQWKRKKNGHLLLNNKKSPNICQHLLCLEIVSQSTDAWLPGFVIWICNFVFPRRARTPCTFHLYFYFVFVNFENGCDLLLLQNLSSYAGFCFTWCLLRVLSHFFLISLLISHWPCQFISSCVSVTLCVLKNTFHLNCL